MNESILHLAQFLYGNKAPGTLEEHIKMLEDKYKKLENVAGNRGYPKEMAKNVFDYVANHHCFDLENYDVTKAIIDTVFELGCPLAADDERSSKYLRHLQSTIGKRANEL